MIYNFWWNFYLFGEKILIFGERFYFSGENSLFFGEKLLILVYVLILSLIKYLRKSGGGI